jgi:hypothetical protein
MDKDDEEVNEGEDKGRTEMQKSRCSSPFPFHGIRTADATKLLLWGYTCTCVSTDIHVAQFRTLLHRTYSLLSLSFLLSTRCDLNMAWWWTDRMGERGEQDKGDRIDE